MRQYILLTLLMVSLSAQGQSFKIIGAVEGKDTGRAVLFYRDHLFQEKTNHAKIVKGKFEFEGLIAGVCLGAIKIDSVMTRSFFLEPRLMTVDLKKNNWSEPMISGSNTENEEYHFLNQIKSERNFRKEISDSLAAIKYKIENAQINSENAEKLTAGLKNKLWAVDLQINIRELDYIDKNLSSFYSLYLLILKIGRISADSIDNYYSRFSENVKNSSLAQEFIGYQRRYRKAISEEYPFDKLELNRKAPPFCIFRRGNNSELTLSDFQGKILLIESWGIDCLPCLKANPILEQIREKYLPQKIEIISLVNLKNETDRQRLASYINHNNLQRWIHVSVGDSAKNEFSFWHSGDFGNYEGLGIPRTVLIDQNGIIIYKSFGFSESEKQEIELTIKSAISRQ